jgi:transposase
VLPATSRVRPRLRALDRRAASSIQVTAADRVNLAWLIEAAADIARLDARVADLDQQIPALLGPARLHTHRRVWDRRGRSDGAAGRGRRPDPLRHRGQVRPLVRGSAGGGVLGRSDQAPTHHRLDLAGNRQVHSTLHLMHVTQVRSYPPARDYIANKRAEHKTKREARRAHKRHLANVVIRRMRADHTRRHAVSTPPPAAATA